MGVVRVDDVLLDDHDRQLLELADVDLDRLRNPSLRSPGVAVAIQDHVVDEVIADVGEQHAEMLAGREIHGLAGLRRDVADVDLDAGRGRQRIPHVG